MAVFSFLTLQQPSESIYKEKGSRFLGFAYPVSSEMDIKARIDALKKKYYDARHHCYAWVLGPEKKQFRAFDDGEPNHSAGDPILGQIRSKELTNVLVVVVRYFGGTKLGVGGLISAYKIAASEALNNGIAIEREVTEKMTLQYDYSATPDVMKLVKEFDLVILKQDFADECLIDVEVKLKLRKEFMDKLKLMKALGLRVGLLSD